MSGVRVRRHVRRHVIRMDPARLHLRGSQDVYVGRDHVGTYEWEETSPGIAFIHLVDVRADWQRKGIGRQIVEQLLDDMRAHGIHRVELESKPGAVGFWERIGFHYDAPLYRNLRGMVLMRYDVER